MKHVVLMGAAMMVGTLSLRAQQPAASSDQTATAAAAQPAPDVKQLLNDVERNEKTGEALRSDYTYHVHFEEDDFNSDGKTKKTTISDSESLAIDGVRVNRLVARNGKPLTEDEKQKENERIDKVVAKARARRAKLEGSGKESTDNGEAMMPASRFLELGTFSNPRGDTLGGRPMIVLDYAGDPHAKTNNETEGIVRDLVGTIWIDQADHVMVQAEGHFLKDFKLGGGLLVNIHAGLTFSLRKEKVNDEVWLPAEINGQGSARVFLFVKMNGRVKLQTSDYRKFRTGATVIPSYRLIGPDGKPLPDQLSPDQPATSTPK